MNTVDKFNWQAIRPLFCLATFLFVATSNSSTWAQDQMSAREHILRGNQFLSRRAFQQAIDEYQAALKVDPSNATAKGNILVSHNNWGMYYALKKDWPRANEEFETCLKIDPNFHDAARNLNLLKRDMEKDSEAGADQPWDPRADEDTGNKSSPQIKATVKKADAKDTEHQAPASPAAVILTPGIKSSASSEANVQPGAAAPAPTDSQAQPGQASAPQAGQAGAPQASGPANYGGQFFNNNKTPLFGTLEDQLTSVEMKVYGHKQEDMPVLKRLEKLEMDTSGTVSQGTIKDRLEHLKQSFGI